jgi:hypothetical protein
MHYTLAMHVLTPLFRHPLWLVTAALALASVPGRAQNITTIINNSTGLSGLEWVGLAGDQVTIWGNGFSAVSSVKFNGFNSPMAGATTAQTITAVIPSGAANSTNVVTVTFMAGGTMQSPQNFIVPPTGPYVRGFLPHTGSPGTTVTINGTRLTGVTSVQFNGTNGVNLQKLSDIQIKIDAPANVTTGPLIVFSNAFAHVTASNFFVSPTITNFSPSFGSAGTNVTIQGRNFTGATAVQFGSLPALYTVLSSTQIVATVPSNAVTAKITVYAPAASVTTTSNFVVRPTISGFNPGFGSPGTLVTINGANLNEGTNLISGVAATNAATIFFNGVRATFYTNVSASQLTTMVPNGATTGKISVTTTNGSGTNDTLFYLPPRITGFTPATNPPGSRIMITGTNFLGATAVLFSGGVPSPSFFVTNNNILGAEVPFGFSTGPISVIAPAGTNTSVDTYFAAPQVTSFNPFSGVPGDVVQVFGNNLAGATSVRFAAPGGFTNAIILGTFAGRIDVRVPTNAMTGPISVVGPAGIGASAANFQLNYSTLEVTVADAPDPAVIGSPLAYTIQVKNLGPNPAAILVTNVLPASVTFDNSTAGSTVGGTTIANLGTVAVNSSASFIVTGVPTTPGVSVTNLTTASSGPLPSYSPTTTITHIEFPAMLKIQFYPPTSLLLSWPTNVSGYALQYRTNLAEGTWSVVPTPPIVDNGTNTVTELMFDAARYYRLKR